MKYGVKVPLFGDEWLWVTRGDSKFHLAPMLFETKQQAEEYALTVWGENARVEEYGQEKDAD